MQEMWLYANVLAEEKRSHPDGTLMSVIANGELYSKKLTELQVGTFFLLMSIAGNETTRTATSHGMKLLLEHPEQLALLIEDMGLLPSAIEEILRFAPPVLNFRRTATCDTELAGQKIAQGDKVVMWYPSGNRDGAVFEDPDDFDITRNPNPHLSFGIGEHFCLGTALARMQLQVIFQELLSAFPGISVTSPPVRTGSLPIDSIEEMEVKLRSCR